MAEAEVQAAEFTSMADTLKNLIPANPFASFVKGNMLQVFFANATGTELPYSLLAIVLLSNTLLSIGAPGVPNSAIASFAALAAIAGLPTGIMGMYVSVNILVDAGATCCNVLGDIASAVAMKKTCRLPDRHA